MSWRYLVSARKERGFVSNYRIFMKILFRLKTSYKELVWCTSYPNVHIHTCLKHWSFIWGCLFPLSMFQKILKNSRMTIAITSSFPGTLLSPNSKSKKNHSEKSSYIFSKKSFSYISEISDPKTKKFLVFSRKKVFLI